MKIDILTLFPDMFEGPFKESIINRALEEDLVEINIHNLRRWTQDRHRTVDNRPYGGGPGMVLMIEPIYKALKDLETNESKVILLTPQGEVFNHKLAKTLSKSQHLILISGHYEGVDERVRQHLVDLEISIGDYILTGGELPAMVVTDAVVRLIPGVLGEEHSLKEESFSAMGKEQSKMENLLEYPQYTRPEKFMGWKVPDVLLSGNHAEIQKWREKQAIKRTRQRRPDLVEK